MWPATRAPLTAIAAATTLAAVAFSLSREPGRGFGEAIRARAFLAEERNLPTCEAGAVEGQGFPCMRDGFDDADGDGVVDCWEYVRDDWSREYLSVWQGCGAGWSARVDVGPISVLPPELSHGAWPRWVAAKLVGDVACAEPAGDAPDCAVPDAAWRWWLDTSLDGWQSGYGDLEADGLRAPVWHAGPVPSAHARALVVPPEVHAEPLRVPMGEDLAGRARVVLADAGSESGASVRCAGLEVSAVGTGLVGYDDVTDRWTWLYQRPIGRRSPVAKLACIDDLVFAYSTDEDDSVVTIVEPHSGGWHVHDGGHCTPARHAPVDTYPDGHHEFGRFRLDELARDLAMPLDQRRDAMAFHEPLRLVRWLDGMPYETHLDPTFPSDDIWPIARVPLTRHLACAGWQVSWSPQTVLVERGDKTHWVDSSVSGEITAVGCKGATLTIEETGPIDALEPAVPHPVSHLVIDFAHLTTWHEPGT